MDHIALFAARREYQAFQVVLRAPASGLTSVQVSASKLVNSDHAIESRNIALYREHYVYVDKASPNWHGSNQSRGAGWYPDPLIPIDAPFAVPAGKNQPIWIDLYVPADAIAGDYSGKIEIRAGKESASIHVKLRVWNFALPLAPSLKSIFQYWTPLERSGVNELVRNKLMPQKAGSAGRESFLMKNYGLNMTTTGFWSGADRGHCSMGPPPSVSQLRRAASSHRRDLALFNYTADEINECKNLYPNIQAWGRNMHQAGIKNLLVMTPVAQLLRSVDVWVVLPSQFEGAKAAISEARKAGDEIWSYNTLVQDGYSPKWLIDYDPIGMRLQAGFLSQTFGLTGLLYWRIDRWGPDALDRVNNEGVFSSNNYPGEGVLIYPGPSGTPVPSMRLKQLRQGVQDYEYVEILKKLGQGDWALGVIHRIAPDWTHWTRDEDALEATRRQLGDKIRDLYSRRAR